MRTVALAAAACLAWAVSHPAKAADPVKLRVADSLPADHYLARIVLQPWMDEVTRRTGGAVVFQRYPNQQLGKAADMLRLTQTGLVDIGYIGPSYVSDKMPVSEVVELPGQFGTVCEGTMAYWKLARTGVVAQADYVPNKIHLLIETALPQYPAFTTNVTIQQLSDFQGLKLRTTGGAQDLTLRALGGIPVRMAAPDAYESLSRGTMDGLLFPVESVISYGLDKLIHHATQGVGFGSFIVAYSIGTDTWNRLPPDVRKAMDDVAEEMEPKLCHQVDDETQASQKRLQTQGMQFTQLPAATIDAIQARLNLVAAEWAKGLDARGKPGTGALKELTTILHPAGG